MPAALGLWEEYTSMLHCQVWPCDLLWLIKYECQKLAEHCTCPGGSSGPAVVHQWVPHGAGIARPQGDPCLRFHSDPSAGESVRVYPFKRVSLFRVICHRLAQSPSPEAVSAGLFLLACLHGRQFSGQGSSGAPDSYLPQCPSGPWKTLCISPLFVKLW